MTISPRMSTGHVEKFEKQTTSQGQNNGGNGGGTATGTLSKKTVKPQLLPTSHNVKRKYSQSKQTMEHESSEDKDAEESNTVSNQQQTVFRSRSKTISDTSGKTLLDTHHLSVLLFSFQHFSDVFPFFNEFNLFFSLFSK